MGHFRKQQITIMPTNACNMSCTYCMACSRNYRGKELQIDIDFAKTGIADYFREDDHHQIRYYCNGEPTMEMDIIKETWEYAHSLVGNKLVSEIQTNCCFDGNATEWLASHITYVWASIDGWPDIQKKYRPIVSKGITHRDLINNALSLKERTFVGIRSTIVPETVDKQVELIEYFYSLGFKHVVSEPVFAPIITGQMDSPGKITGIDLKVYAENFVEAWHVAEKLGMSYLNSFMVNFDEQVEYACRACLPTPHLTTDGYVSSCDLAFYGDTPLSDLIYGKYDQVAKVINYYPDKISKLRSRKCQNIEECKMCSVSSICGGGCLGRMYHETRNFFGVISDYCDVTRYLAKNLPLDRIKINYLHP